MKLLTRYAQKSRYSAIIIQSTWFLLDLHCSKKKWYKYNTVIHELLEITLANRESRTSIEEFVRMEELVLLAGVVRCDKRKKLKDYGSISASTVLVVLLSCPIETELLESL